MDDVATLVQRARDGSPDELVERYRGLAFRVAIEWLADPHLAEDAVQEAFAEALGNLDSLRDPSAFGAWLRMIVRKHADRMTRRRRVAIWPDLYAPDPAEAVERRVLGEQVRAALASAAACDRSVLWLRYMQDRSYAEIAETLNVPVSTVRKRLHDARRRLKPAVASLWREEINMMGRMIASDGRPLDGGAAVTIPVVAPATRHRSDEPMLTGIKVIDVCAPLVRGGTVELRGPAGTGQAVNVGELIVLQARERNAVAVVAGIAENDVAGALSAGILRDTPAAEHALIVLGPPRETGATAMQAAEAFAAEGKDVLLVVDVELATEDVLSFAGLRNGRGAVTVVVFAPQYPEDPDRRLLGCDTTLEFSRRLAATGLYPAIDPVTSSSRLLEEGHVSPRHARAASRLKELVAAGSRLESFMTQPYVVAEDFTKLPGEQVRLDDAIGGVERIADGEAHGLDPKTLLYAGTLEQAMARED